MKPFFFLCVALAVVACGSADGRGDGLGGTGAMGAQPPPPPTNPSPPSGSTATLAINKLFMGDTDRSGAPDPSAWKQFGYNLDGIVTSCEGTSCNQQPLCKPFAGSHPGLVHPDGNGGIDNAFGRLLLPAFTGVAQDYSGQGYSAQINASIASGDVTYIFDLAGVGSDASYAGIDGRIYEGSSLPSFPDFDGNDVWPVTYESLSVAGDLSQPNAIDHASYVNDHVWVGRPASLVLRLALAGSTFDFHLERPIISMRLSPDRRRASDGVIAGLIPVESFVDELRQLLGAFDQACEGTTFESLADVVRQSADSLLDGTQDPTRTCEAISIGLGFDATAVVLGGVAEPAPPLPDPCR